MEEFVPINPKEEKTVISIRMDVKTLQKIDEASSVIDISRNELIVQCVEFALKYLNSPKEKVC